MEFLRKLLKANGVEEEVIKQILKDCPDMVTKASADKIQDDLTQAKKDLKASQDKVDELEKSNKSIEILEQQVTDLKKEKQDIQDKYDGEMREIKIKTHVKEHLGAKLKDGKYLDLLYKELDTSKFEVKDDGTVEGFDSKSLEDKYPDLFCGDDSFKNPPRQKPGKGEENSLGARLAKQARVETPKENPYF